MSALDDVRLLIGDTDLAEALLSNDEIASLITQRTQDGVVNVPAAAADAALAIAGAFSRNFSFAEDGQRFDVAQRVAHYLQLERELRNRSGAYTVAFGPTSA